MENMAFYHSINKVIAGEDHVNFIYQYVKDSDSSVNEYNYRNTCSISKTHRWIIGPPTNFPNYGDSLRTFVMRTHGFDISTSPWQKPIPNTCSLATDKQYDSDMYCNYIDLEFHEAVYPVRVSIYEVYNPGYVTKIWAQGKQQYPDDITLTKKKQWENNQWFLLWSGPPQNAVPLTSRIFSPPLKFCDFKTKILRLQFMYSHWDYSTRLDAVKLIGTSKLVLPKNPELNLTNLLKSINCKYSCHGDKHNLTPDHEAAHLDIVQLQKKFSKYCVICKSNTANSFNTRKFGHKQISQEIDVARSKQRYRNPFIKRGIYRNYLLRHHPNYAKLIKDIELYSNEYKEQSCSSFSTLPDEIVLIIFKNLDIKSLCRTSQVNKRFNILTRDPLLIKCLNLRNLRNTKSFCNHNVLFYFTFTCKYLQRLDLKQTNISVEHFNKFVNNCGNLTHLRLSGCGFLVDSVLLRISITCKMLKVLDVSFCNNQQYDSYKQQYKPLEFSCLENLEFLEDLNLRGMSIETETLCKILQKNRRMRNLNLSTFCGRSPSTSYKDRDAVAIQLGTSCPDLEIIDLTGCGITSRGIKALAECKNLRKLNISYTNYFGGTDQGNFGEPLTLCKNLKQILLDVPIENADSFAIFEQCPKLQTIYLQYERYNTTNGHLVALKEKYPHLSIYEYTGVSYEMNATYGYSCGNLTNINMNRFS
ncbi:F-box/LRR-repeat protein 4-like isoform X2 [Temnothorax longispinosus]|uniref:F-box/LRR-repeat protein 4-like isoform X2 n=1 Tax=Temnothorax longispinosus TaxID=300112 RepID=UPI003A99C551